MASPNLNPKRTPILDSFPNVAIRHGRGGRLCNLGSARGGSTSTPSSRSGPSSRTKGSHSQRSSSRNKESSEPLCEPLVEEVIPSEISFNHDRESLRTNVASLDRDDPFPTQITDILAPLFRKDCYWRDDFPIIVPNSNQRITSYLIGFSSVYTYPFTLSLNRPLTWSF